MEKVAIYLKNILLKFHEWIQKKWFVVSFFISTSSIWFSLVLNFWGVDWKLIIVDEDGKRSLTLLGIVLTISIVGFSFLTVLAQRYYEYRKLNTDNDKRKLFILESVDLETNKICDYKFTTLKKRIWKIKGEKNGEPPKIVSNPCEQLKHITDKMTSCLCKLLSQKEYDLKEDELYISLHYNFPLEDNNLWQRTASLSPEKGLNTDDLLNEKSTFAKALKSREPLVFFNDKELAKRDENYLHDEEDKVDENGYLMGSIACYRINVKESGEELIKAVLSISTYKKKFVNSDKKTIISNVKFNMDEYILKPFIKRIQIELCLLYLLSLHENRIEGKKK